MPEQHTHPARTHLHDALLMLIVALTVCSFQATMEGSIGAHFFQKARVHIQQRPVKIARTRVLRRVIVNSAANDWAPAAAQTAPEPRLNAARSSISSVRTKSAVTSVASIAIIAHEPLRAAAAARDAFPAFDRTVFPVSHTPDWGTMRTPEQWNKRYEELSHSELLPAPSYDLEILRIPLETLKARINEATSIAAITAKLFYSTRFFGAYHLDSGEYAFAHPGIDLKLAPGTPVGAIAGGRVHKTGNDADGLGLHVIIEHRLNDETYYSVYGHFESISVSAGNTVTPGQTIGYVGDTGFATAPHLHLQIDRGEQDESNHAVYWPATVPTRSEALRHTVHPIEFIAQYRNGISH